MSNITPKEAIANLNHLYGMVAPDIQRSLDVAFKCMEERPQGDCISREALKKAIEEVEDDYDGYEPNDLGKFMWKVGDLIDSAPPVEHSLLPLASDLDSAYMRGYEAGLAQGKQDRPKGEWLKSGKGKTTFFCSECGREIDTKPFTRPDNFPFCHCGADMRKGGAE